MLNKNMQNKLHAYFTVCIKLCEVNGLQQKQMYFNITFIMRIKIIVIIL